MRTCTDCERSFSDRALNNIIEKNEKAYRDYNAFDFKGMKIYIQKTSVCAVRTRPSVPSIGNYRKGSSYYTSDAHNFITTVVNRMSMPESPTISNKSTEFKFMYDHFHRVILHYTNWTDDATGSVSRRVKMAVPVLTLKDCEVIVKQTSKYGMCIVCTVQHDKAMLYRDALLQSGLNATIEEA